ncbi:hypothetical protein [Streptomyces chartreusis]|uniref:hypothetical protein n=1 Tax=Streptomyces chartreusis TaxID=1969 RepID=UPI0037DCF265|nr:hypothetical protein OG938_48145 [Streptomyces chartreusis]WTA33867.1 hypothetical protein OIA45_48510 [Streptomyces chartreusis]
MTTARLAATVYVRDPDTHQTVELAQGTSPEPRLAALVRAKGAWVDGKPPRPAKTQTDSSGQDPTGDGPDDASGDASDTSGDGNQPSTPEGDSKAAPAAKKTAARKTAASKPARGREAADQGDSGN